MDLDEGALKLIDPENLTVLNTQPIHTIRVWGVGRDNGRYGIDWNTWNVSWESPLYLTLVTLSPFSLSSIYASLYVFSVTSDPIYIIIIIVMVIACLTLFQHFQGTV